MTTNLRLPQDSIKALIGQFEHLDFETLRDSFPAWNASSGHMLLKLRTQNQLKSVYLPYWPKKALSHLKDEVEKRQIEELQALADRIDSFVGTSRYLK